MGFWRARRITKERGVTGYIETSREEMPPYVKVQQERLEYEKQKDKSKKEEKKDKPEQTRSQETYAKGIRFRKKVAASRNASRARGRQPYHKPTAARINSR